LWPSSYTPLCIVTVFLHSTMHCDRLPTPHYALWPSSYTPLCIVTVFLHPTMHCDRLPTPHYALWPSSYTPLCIVTVFLHPTMHCDRLPTPHYAWQEFFSTLPLWVWASADSGHGFSFSPSEWSECKLINLHCLPQPYGCLFRSESTGFVTRHAIYSLSVLVWTQGCVLTWCLFDIDVILTSKDWR